MDAEGSLILREEAEALADAQMCLFHGVEIDRSKPVFHSTGERLFRYKPAVYRLVVSMLAEDLPVRRIAAACGVSDHTVKAVRERELVPIATSKKMAAKVASRVNLMLAERLEELAPTASFKDAAIAYGITFDKVALYSGDPTARLELTQPAESIFDRLARLQADLIGLAGEKMLANGAGAIGPRRIAGGPVFDLESDVSEGSSMVSGCLPADVAAADTESGGLEAGQPGGGRGSAQATPAPSEVMGSAQPNFIPKGGQP